VSGSSVVKGYMSKVRVKICGITNWTDARRAAAAGADFLGFNFYPGSPRYIRPASARRIVRRLPRSVQSVGVFVNEKEDKMLRIARAVGLDYLQLHGDESPSAVARLSPALPVIKAVRIAKSFRLAELASFRRASSILLDAFDRRSRGGTGRSIDWKIARGAAKQNRIFLAGGLTPENVAAAIWAVKPYAVDVCSGVEARPGKKDHARVQALINAVRQTPAAPRTARKSQKKGTR
jgi:phosphoribosylanthranilate isomerase